MIDSIQISSKKLSDVPKTTSNKSTEITNKAEFDAAWKRGDFKGKVKEFENMYSKFYEDVSR